MNITPKLLWLDCSAGAIAGIVVTLSHNWLSTLYGLPADFILFMGLANLAYASFSFSLALTTRRPFPAFLVLVTANITWGVLCLYWLVSFWDLVTPFAVAHLFLEGVFVGGLGIAEWTNRHKLKIGPFGGRKESA